MLWQGQTKGFCKLDIPHPWSTWYTEVARLRGDRSVIQDCSHTFTKHCSCFTCTISFDSFNKLQTQALWRIPISQMRKLRTNYVLKVMDDEWQNQEWSPHRVVLECVLWITFFYSFRWWWWWWWGDTVQTPMSNKGAKQKSCQSLLVHYVLGISILEAAIFESQQSHVWYFLISKGIPTAV